MARMSSPRRRQRSVRVTVAVVLMAAATATVLVALSLVSLPVLSGASVFALLCGWAAARILHTELVQSRKAHARERAVQARDFRALFVERSTEHAAFASAMADRLAARDREIFELEGTLRLSEARAADAEDRVRRESQRTNQAQRRVAELETALAIRAAEEADELASWSPGYADMDTVVDLLSWEDRAQGALPTHDRKHA